MSEIEVNEYVRTKDGIIGKVQRIHYDEQEKQNYYICEKDNVMASDYIEDIVNHSKDIIDLIEVRRLCEWRKSKSSLFRRYN